MHLFLQMSKVQETTSYCDENVGRVGVKSDTMCWIKKGRKPGRGQFTIALVWL